MSKRTNTYIEGERKKRKVEKQEKRKVERQEKPEAYEEEDLEVEEQEKENESCVPLTTTKLKNLKTDKISWPSHDIAQLLERIEKMIPANDTLPYHSRLEKINWEEVIFKSYSVKECKEVWIILQKQIRKHRCLGEIVGDMKSLIKEPTSLLKVQHPVKPKGPSSPFLIFAKEKREDILKQHPGMKQQLLATILGEKYRELSTEEREKYKHQAEICRIEYKEKLLTFYEDHPEMIPTKLKKGTKKIKLGPNNGPPAKPKTPFELFVQNLTESDESINVSKCRELWDAKSPNEKYSWIVWSEEQHMKYMQDLKEYLKTHPDYEPKRIKKLTKQEQQIKDRMSGKPEKPPSSAFRLFWKMLRENEDVPRISSRAMLSYVGEKWKFCSDEEKEEYQILWKHMWEIYNKQLDDYIMTVPPEDRDRVRNELSNKKVKRKKRSKTPDQLEPQVKLKSPQMPPATPYKCFLRSYKGKKNSLEAWKAMSNEKKKRFEEECSQLKQKFIASYEEYLKTLSKEELQKLAAPFMDQYDGDVSSESEPEC